MPFGRFIEDAAHVLFGGKRLDDSGSTQRFLTEGSHAGEVLLDFGLGGLDALARPVDDEGKERDKEKGDCAQYGLHVKDKGEGSDCLDWAINRVADDHDGGLVDADIVADDGLDFAGALVVEVRDGEPHEFFEEALAEVGGEAVGGFAEIVDLTSGEDVFEGKEEDDTETGDGKSSESVVLSEFDLVLGFLVLELLFGFLDFLGQSYGVEVDFCGDFFDLCRRKVEVVAGLSGALDGLAELFVVGLEGFGDGGGLFLGEFEGFLGDAGDGGIFDRRESGKGESEGGDGQKGGDDNAGEAFENGFALPFEFGSDAGVESGELGHPGLGFCGGYRCRHFLGIAPTQSN